MKEMFKVLFFILASLSVSAMDAKHCKIAGCSSEKVRKCLGCEAVYYCSQDHQKQDWPNHKKSCRKIKQAWESLQNEASQENIINIQRDPNGIIFQLTKEESELLQSRLMKPLRKENDWDVYYESRNIVFLKALADSTSPKEAYEFSGTIFKKLWGSDYEQKFAQIVDRERLILSSLLSLCDNKEVAYLVFMVTDLMRFKLSNLVIVWQMKDDYHDYMEFMRNKNITVQDLVKLKLAKI